MRVLSDDERRPNEPAGNHHGDFTAEFCRAGDAQRDAAAHTIALPQRVQSLATETWPSSSLFVAKSSSGNLPTRGMTVSDRQHDFKFQWRGHVSRYITVLLRPSPGMIV